ncbi:LADA_0D13234g1_1 [Lachancea dasiensis]|uniref:LADA_0D13234g1_1 n=1 Tax=Lachancea dasiensis TaxID=1072105 RepID=A0A1G4J8T2_9SACH|nr:LADA_0D13234g1_1 [Lachancea dasiensis]
MTINGKLRISIDRGGTFTDCIAVSPGREDIVIKILSVDPQNYPDAPSEAIRRVLEIFRRQEIQRGTKLNLDDVDQIRMGTTVATNALLERNGEKCALIVTKGLKDLLLIGNQSRPDMFDAAINRPDVLYKGVYEVDERVTLEDWSESKVPSGAKPNGTDMVRGVSGELVRIIKPLDMEKTRATLLSAFEAGFKSIAICLMHSYTFPDHEMLIGKMAKELGFTQISQSSVLSPKIGITGRGFSATADSYLTPVIKTYIATFKEAFEDDAFNSTRCQFMQSDGGIVEFDNLSGLCAILSGPAGGVVGYSETTYDDQLKTPVIGFDMGGTSTDVSRFGGQYEHVFETTTAGVSIQSPQLDINTVAAGGGSILHWKSGLFTVGPDSASAHPGPACYRKGGPLTITDANLILGRLILDKFPKIFGPNEDEPLDTEISYLKFADITRKINKDTGKSLSPFEVAEGFLKVANESMCRPIRTLTEARGFDAASHVLASFGGAGGQHACLIAKNLGISTVVIHKYSSLLSAYGIYLADIVNEEQVPCARELSQESLTYFKTVLSELAVVSESKLEKNGIDGTFIYSELFLNMRYKGSSSPIMVQKPKSSWDFEASFGLAHEREYGFKADRPIIIDDIRVRSIGKPRNLKPLSPLREMENISFKYTADARSINEVFFETSFMPTPVFSLKNLSVGDKVKGPALLADETQTIVVTPGSTAFVLSSSIVISVSTSDAVDLRDNAVDPIQLSIFNHRFMGVAEQMGRALQRTSISTNIKERLDFTCSVFSPAGGLVANAPHVPAMIGSMAFAVKWQIDFWKNDIRDGDVILSNAPEAGGTHLPDLTVITPVFDSEGKEIIFWTASRGHHADIGGILPGSMPPSSRELWEEGAFFKAFKIVENGNFKEKELIDLLCVKPTLREGGIGTRCLKDNIADLKAQIAANHKGVLLIRSLMHEYGQNVVQLYMDEIQKSSDLAIRGLLKKVYHEYGPEPLEGEDYMDDGTPLHLKVTITPDDWSATFDFSGTGPEVYANWNAPIAITHSSIIFSLRCMVNAEIPLNQGCINPINVIVPEGCLLKPGSNAACCAGNVLTSQRLTDTIFKVFRFSGASQGCMNNFTFGIDGENGFGYYETICGGSGAGPTWDGTSGVHTNMTNTRITDPEIMERRYPILVKQFSIRDGTGGAGKFNGGSGVVRDIEFTLPMIASILSERRTFQPYGMNGGEPGARGLNLWYRKNGQVVNIGSKGSVAVQKGDRIQIMTPGGGGYGCKEDRCSTTEERQNGGNSSRAFFPRANGTVGIMRSLGESN